ncbi:MAG: ISNCY family transposase [Bacteroidetes bacterium]|nr:ISNCY family transposase [Bacteroidota bacterium]
MTKDEQEIYGWVLDFLGNRLSLDEVSALSGKSYRQCQRIVAKVRKQGMLGVTHGNSGRSPVNKTTEALKIRITDLIRTRYYDLNVTHLQEKLVEVEKIQIKYDTLRKLVHSVGVPKKARKRRKKKAHCLRPRMPREGMLVQFDGSEHRWFAESKLISTLIGGIDDSTGKILGLEFSSSEDTFSCFRVMRSIAEKHGIPQAYYLDRASHFGRYDQEQAATQIGRALGELGSKVILASSPQSKGRIERLWGTLQDRLIVELRLRGINRIPQANEYLSKEFIDDYNSRFAIEPRESDPAFSPLIPELDLDLIFGIKEQRKIASDQTFSYRGKTYLLHTDEDLRYRTVEVCSNEIGAERFLVFGREYKASVVQSSTQKMLKNAA